MLKFLKHTNPYSDLSDEKLIEVYIIKKDKECVAVLFSRYTHLVFGICMKYLKNLMESEDATMEIFEELFEKLLVHNVRNFNTWIYSVTRNKCLMILRSRKNREGKTIIFREFNLDDVDFYSEIHPLIEEKQNTNKEKIEIALTGLKEEQQCCIKLMYLEEKSYKEICTITGYSLKMVKSHIQNGKRKLRILLAK